MPFVLTLRKWAGDHNFRISHPQLHSEFKSTLSFSRHCLDLFILFYLFNFLPRGHAKHFTEVLILPHFDLPLQVPVQELPHNMTESA